MSEEKQFKGGMAYFGLEVEGALHQAGEGTVVGSTMMTQHGAVTSPLLPE